MALRITDFDEKTQAKILAASETGDHLPVGILKGATKPTPKSIRQAKARMPHGKRSKRSSSEPTRSLVSRPWHLIPVRLCVGALAYGVQGTGWAIGKVANLVWDAGIWLHEFKWRID